nr:mycofactocin system transcriptional regulator [Microbacterium bovistercoris]
MDENLAESASGAADRRSRGGRSPSTSRDELSHIALELFLANGFDETTVDEIARAARIGRRTFFRYYASKNDLAWGSFDELLAKMAAHLDALGDSVALMDALHEAVIEFNRFPEEEIPFHRERMRLILTVPSLIAHSSLRYADWRQVVVDYAARRLGESPDAFRPRAIGWTCLGMCLASYEQWLAGDDEDLLARIDEAFGWFTMRGTALSD